MACVSHFKDESHSVKSKMRDSHMEKINPRISVSKAKARNTPTTTIACIIMLNSENTMLPTINATPITQYEKRTLAITYHPSGSVTWSIAGSRGSRKYMESSIMNSMNSTMAN